jgi:hypothetical protein
MNIWNENMNIKCVIGSIIVVVAVIGISFTSVVGNKSIESDVNVSPLFNIRTNNAIGKENNNLNCYYANKGKIISIPKRDDNVIIIQKIVDSIHTMDDETFEKYVNYIICNAHRDKGVNDINPYDIRKALYLLRYSGNSIYSINPDSENITYGYGLKGFVGCTFSEPLCFIKYVLVFIARLVLIILCELQGPPVGSVVVCPPPTI